MVIGDLKRHVRLKRSFFFRKRQRLSLQARILSTQGQVESFDQTGIYVLEGNALSVAVNNSPADGHQAPAFFLFHHLGIAKLGDGLFLRTTRPAPLSRRRIGNGDMVAIKQGHPVTIQSITDKQRHLPIKDIGRALDQFRSALLGSRTHHHRQDQSVF